jgi:hypothetical protein
MDSAHSTHYTARHYAAWILAPGFPAGTSEIDQAAVNLLLGCFHPLSEDQVEITGITFLAAKRMQQEKW